VSLVIAWNCIKPRKKVSRESDMRMTMTVQSEYLKSMSKVVPLKLIQVSYWPKKMRSKERTSGNTMMCWVMHYRTRLW